MSTLRLTAAFLFSSGLCALIYQTVWLRAFRLIFGASTPSSAAVLAIFMGGLGLGGLLLGRRVERSTRPLVTYGNLEIGVAVSTALTPFLLDAARAAYVGLGGSEGLGSFAALCVRIALATLVLGVPVVLMGGTLPAAARAVTAQDDLGRKGLAVLYGINTLGAVTGTVVSTFFLLEIYGARMTLWLACLLNVAIGVAARGVGRGLPLVTTTAAAPHTSASDSTAIADAGRLWVLAGAFTTGFTFLLVELVWYRMAAPLLGGSTYSFGLVLACALAGIAIGGMLYAFAGPTTPTPGRFALTCALEAVCILAPYALGDELAYLAFFLREYGKVSFSALVATWTIVMSVLVVPAAIVAGYQFPMLLALRGRGASGVARDSGEVYAANTLGSILGSLAGGFGLLPLLGAPLAWRVAAVALFAVGALFAARAYRHERGRVLVFAGLAVVLGLFLQARGPTAIWRHSAIGAGRAALKADDWNGRESEARARRAAILHEEDGLESSIAINDANGLSPLVNGKSDGNNLNDAPTGVGSGLLPALLHPAAQDAFVIGLGTGQTAGWLGKVATMKRVDVVEIEQAMVDFAARCADTNADALNNPRVKLHIEDGREALLVTDRQYDVILSEPSNPYRAGLASFYSTEFYEGVKSRLRPGGYFGQWMQGYEVEPEAIQLAIATLHKSFPHISVWQLSLGDILLIASQEDQVVDADGVRARLQQEPYRTAFGRLFGVVDVEGVLGLYLASDKLTSMLAAAVGDEVNSDDVPLLEFMFARSVGRSTQANLALKLNDAAEVLGAARPVVTGAVSWDRVDDQRLRLYVLYAGVPPHTLAARVPEALKAAAGRADDAAVAQFRSAAPLTPRGTMLELLGVGVGVRPLHLDPAERLLRATSYALAVGTTKDERLALRDELSVITADGFMADALWLRVINDTALGEGTAGASVEAEALEAMAATRNDPWVNERILTEGLHALQTHAASPELARALMQPFAGYALNFMRRNAVLEVLANDPQGPAPLCVDALASFEPNTPWNANMLAFRVQCYERHAPERAPLARAELDLYRTHVVGPFVLGEAPAG